MRAPAPASISQPLKFEVCMPTHDVVNTSDFHARYDASPAFTLSEVTRKKASRLMSSLVVEDLVREMEIY